MRERLFFFRKMCRQSVLPLPVSILKEVSHEMLVFIFNFRVFEGSLARNEVKMSGLP